MSAEEVSVAAAPPPAPVPASVAVGRDAERLQQLITNFDAAQLREVLWDVDAEDGTGGVCLEALELLRSMNDTEKAKCCRDAVQKLLNKENSRYVQLENILTKLFIKAFDEGIIPLSECCELLIACTDFTFHYPIDAKKFEFMHEKLHLIDYKGLRGILKLLVVDRMQELPPALTLYQRQTLLPVENMLLTLIDRPRNLLPCLFTITELQRISTNSRAFLMPRVAKKFNEMFISFRPLAEMVTVLGRPWLFPISTHISFLLIASSWRLDPVTTRIHQRAHLPFKSEMFAPQSALLYSLLRQPRGREAISWMMRPSSGNPRLQCDELLHMIILEAMSEMEKTENRVEDQINQYQWMNITHTVTFSLLHLNASFSRLLKILHESLLETVYRKGRAELMWIILQYVAVYINSITPEDMQRIADIYNLLYRGEETCIGVDTDPLFFVRIFVPAAIWIHFYTKHPNETPQPSEYLQSRIHFLRNTAEPDQHAVLKNVADHNAVLAAAANAYSNDLSTFTKLVVDNVEAFLDSRPEDREVCHLPHMVMCNSKRVPLSLILIDSLTFHSRSQLFQVLIGKISSVIQLTPPLKYPSPAVVDTLVRLTVTTDFEYGMKQITAFMTKTIESVREQGVNERCKDLLYICCEMFSYCFVHCPFPLVYKGNLLYTVCTVLSNQHLHMNPYFYSAFEQFLLRFWVWNCPQELCLICNQLIGKQGKLSFLLTSPESFNDYPSAVYDRNQAHISPESTRLILLAYFRALKMTGVEMQSEVIVRCNKNFIWPRSTYSLYAAQIQGCSVDDPNDQKFAQMEECFQYVLRDVRQLGECLYPNMEDQVMKFFNEERILYNLFCIAYTILYDMKKVYPVFYSILKTTNAKQIVRMTNKLVEHVIHQAKKISPADNASFTTLIGTLNEMVFRYQFIPFERFLLSFVLHPTDDESTQIALVIIHSMVLSFGDIANRLGILFHIIPSNKFLNNNTMFFAKLTDYYAQYPELTYQELETKLRHEMRMDMSMRRMEQQPSYIDPAQHLPIYYGNFVERILPMVDIMLIRALEIDVADEIFYNLLAKFKPCYKYHPQPAAFMYSVLYCLDKKLAHTPRAQKFVSEIGGQLEERDGRNSLLIQLDQVVNPQQLCMALVDRILQGVNFTHQPPAFACKEWRFSELPPAGQALTGACIELLASPFRPDVTARALIGLAFMRPLQQPYATINSVALILTSLPSSFQKIFHEHIVSVVASPELMEGAPIECFGKLEDECFLLTESQIMTNLALCHAYVQHATNSALNALPEFVREQLVPILKTESQLIFILRLVVPILQRFYDTKERSKQLQDMAVDVYKMTVKVNEIVGPFLYEDTICDFLYHMKYMYVGDFVKNEAEQSIQRLTQTMREKLTYISHSQANASDSIAYKQSFSGAASFFAT